MRDAFDHPGGDPEAGDSDGAGDATGILVRAIARRNDVAGGGDPDGTDGGVRGLEEFGPYIVYERLGQGGMATVHRAEKRGVGIRRPIALKRLLPHVAADPDLVKLFVDEARLASHLRHANVAQTYELGKVDDTFFIAMEYASGPSLAQIVRQCQKAAGEIPLTITVNILTQVCEALDYAHNLCDETGKPLRIIHRDVSPANIVVTNTGIVKLIDFGIAKTTLSSVKTQTGFIKGKFGYIAPEYISGKIDARVDLFAVGVVAHEMLAGRRLFEGQDDFETLANIREMVMQPPSRWNPHVTPDIDDIVMTALERDPDKRWQSAAAMQVALAHAAREFGMVVGSQQLAEWVEWAFSQVPPDSGPVIRAETNSGDTRAIGLKASARSRRDSSVQIEIGAATEPVETITPPADPRRSSTPDLRRSSTPDLRRSSTPDLRRSSTPEPPRGVSPPPRSRAHDSAPPPPPPPRSRPHDSASPPPLPRSRPHDSAPPPPPPPRSRSHDSAPPPPPPPRSRSHDSAPPPPPPPPRSRSHDSAPPPPLPRTTAPSNAVASPPLRPTPQPVDAGVSPVPPSYEVQVIAMPPGGMFDAPSAEPARPGKSAAKAKAKVKTKPGRTPKAKPAPEARPTSRASAPSAKSPSKPGTPRQEDSGSTSAAGQPSAPRPARAASALPPKRRTVLWLILLMLALGVGAMAAAYYWPEDLIHG